MARENNMGNLSRKSAFIRARIHMAEGTPMPNNPMGGQTQPMAAPSHPMVPMSPQMLTAIQQSPKGKLPPSLLKHKKGKKSAIQK